MGGILRRATSKFVHRPPVVVSSRGEDIPCAADVLTFIREAPINIRGSLGLLMFEDTSAGWIAHVARLFGIRKGEKPRAMPVAVPPTRVVPIVLPPSERAYPAMHILGLNR